MRAFLLRILLLAGICAVLASARRGCAAPGAPAPLPRRAAARGLTPGAYALWWGGQRWELLLSPGGGWRTTRGRLCYVGGYAACGGVLRFSERAEGADSAAREYEVELDGQLRGRTRCGVEVRLERAR